MTIESLVVVTTMTIESRESVKTASFRSMTTVLVCTTALKKGSHYKFFLLDIIATRRSCYRFDCTWCLGCCAYHRICFDLVSDITDN